MVELTVFLFTQPILSILARDLYGKVEGENEGGVCGASRTNLTYCLSSTALILVVLILRRWYDLYTALNNPYNTLNLRSYEDSDVFERTV